MKFVSINKLFPALLLCLLCIPAVHAATYQVTVDTSSLEGTNGYVDFQLNPADISAPGAIAEVSNLQGSMVLFSNPDIFGDISGALPGTLTLSNGTAFNDYFQAVQFGHSFSFTLDIGGEFLTQPSLLGSSFALSLYAVDGVNPLLSSDVSGAVAIFELANQSVAFQTFADSNGTHAAQVSTVPVPAAGWLLLSGLLGMCGFARRR